MVVTVHDAEKIGEVVFEAGVLEQAVEKLLEDTSLGENVVRQTREAMFGMGRNAITYRPGALPIEAWSTGEKSLWLFLASLAGHQPINLYGLAAQFKGTPEAGHIATIVQLLMLDA